MRFATDEFYHIVNRGVEGRRIFQQKSDYRRFLAGLRNFNSTEPTLLRSSAEVEPLQKRGREAGGTKALVDIVSYCLMKNHVHFLLRVIRPENTSLFLQKLFGGYTMYFNIKYERKGVLFQGKAKAQHVDNDTYLQHVIHYIHLNPLDYIDKQWREHSVKNVKRAREAVLEYPWSSIRAVIGEEQNDIICQTLTHELISSKRELLNDMLAWSSEEVCFE